MEQMARNGTMEDSGFLNHCRYLLHDRDRKYCQGFRDVIREGGIEPIALPARSPNLNAYAEHLSRRNKKTTSCCSPCGLQQSQENKNRCAVGNGWAAC